MAKIYQKTVDDRTLILGTREALLYPFTAPSWTDLRLSAWVSVTQTSADDDNTSLTETLTYSTTRDLVCFGFKDNSSNFPRTAGTVFVGVSHNSATGGSFAANGTTDWDADGTGGSNYFATVWDGVSLLANSANGKVLQLPGTAQNSGTYSQFWVVKMTRSTGSSLSVANSMVVDSLRSGTPTVASLRSNSSPTFPAGSTTSSQTLSAVPTCVFIYWPFNNSRLRVHALVLEKYAP